MFTYSLTRFTESRRDQEEGSELDSHEEVRLSLAGPGEIKWREVLLDPEERSEGSWTLTKKLDCHLRVQARSGEGRCCWTLKRAQKRAGLSRRN